MTDDRDIELTVYFDWDCALCRRVAAWLEGQPTYVPLHCVAAQTATPATCPMGAEELLARLTVTASDGATYYGTRAWLVCLWALRRYRGWSLALSSDRWMPTAERLFAVVAGLAQRTRPSPRSGPQLPSIHGPAT